MRRTNFVFGTLFGILLATAAGAQMDYHYMVHKKEVPLRVDDRTILVVDDAGRPHEEVAADLRAAGLEGFEARQLAPGQHLFVRPATSAEARTVPVPELIRAVAGRPGNTYFLSPRFLVVNPATGKPYADGGLTMADQILVRFSPDLRQGEAQSILSTMIPHGRTAVHGWLDDPNTFIYEVFSGSAIEVLALANQLAVLDEVRWAEPTITAEVGPSNLTGGTCQPVTLDPDTVENPNYDQSWNLEAIGAQYAWQACGGNSPPEEADADVVLVVYDNGIDPDHPDLNQITPGRNTYGVANCNSNCIELGGEPRTASNNHGTAVAGSAGGRINNGLGSTGIAPNVKLFSMRTFHTGVNAEAICYAVKWVRSDLRNEGEVPGMSASTRIVSNMSYNWKSAFSCLNFQFELSRSEGIVQVVSAGNWTTIDPTFEVRYPGTNKDVFTVGATDETGHRASFSRYGIDGSLEPGIGAPGSNVFTTDRTGTEGYSDLDYHSSRDEDFVLEGTSHAAPLVAGTAALLLSLYPQMTVAEVEERICASAVPLPGERLGCGRLDAGAAVYGWIFRDGFETGDTSLWSSASN